MSENMRFVAIMAALAAPIVVAMFFAWLEAKYGGDKK